MELKNFLSHIKNPQIYSMLSSIIYKNISAQIWSSAPDSLNFDYEKGSTLIQIHPKIWILLGNPHIKSANIKYRSVFNEKIIQLKKNNHGYYKIFYDNEEWIDVIKLEILNEHEPPILDSRICYKLEFHKQYILKEINFEYGEIVFDVINSKNIDHLTQFENWKWVEDELCENWTNIYTFLRESGVGAIAYTHNKEIVGWILSEFQSPVALGIGIEVSPNFRRRGIAKQLGNIFLREIIDRDNFGDTNILILWDAWYFNKGSLKVAEKIGFSEKIQYNILYGFWDDISHNIEQSYYWNDRYKYDAAVEFILNAIQLTKPDVNYQFYFWAAKNYMLANNIPKTLEFLKLSIESCSEPLAEFKDQIKNNTIFLKLAELPEFLLLIGNE